jgi:uncharacterized membrane protein YeaQ/YmgE (transglycosylase-associated protein family)
MGVILFIVIGFVAGLIARAVLPGRQQQMGIAATTILGMVGSLVGGIIGSLFSRESITSIHPSGVILSIIGAIIVLYLWTRVGGQQKVSA